MELGRRDAGADGVHLGQSDLPLRVARALCPPGFLIGVSTHDEEQVEAALEGGADYIAFGPIYPTASKDNPDPVLGVARLRGAKGSPRASTLFALLCRASTAPGEWTELAELGVAHAVDQAAAAFKAPAAELTNRIGGALDQIKALEKEIAALKGKLASSQGDELVNQVVEVKGLKVLAAALPGADAKTLRDTMDKLKDKLKTAAIVLAAVDGGKVQIAAGATADVMGKVKAGELVNFVAQQVGGKGGGRPDMAQAGGTDAAKLPEALASVQGFVSERI